MESRIKQFRCGRKELPGVHALEHKMAAALLDLASTSKARRNRSIGTVWLLI